MTNIVIDCSCEQKIGTNHQDVNQAVRGQSEETRKDSHIAASAGPFWSAALSGGEPSSAGVWCDAAIPFWVVGKHTLKASQCTPLAPTLLLGRAKSKWRPAQIEGVSELVCSLSYRVALQKGTAQRALSQLTLSRRIE